MRQLVQQRLAFFAGGMRGQNFAPQRERYLAYVAELLALAGWDDPEGNAKKVLDFETRIAEAHWTRAQSRDRDKTYNPLALPEFDAKAPGFPWASFFEASGVGHAERAVVRQDSAIPQMAKVFADTDLDTLKAWQAADLVDSMAPLLPARFVKAHYEFREKFMSGQPQPRERWKRAVSFVEGVMGEAIGRDYVALYFPPDAKAKMDDLVANVKLAMGARLDALEWMSPATKAEARAKLAGFGLKIGHRRFWLRQQLAVIASLEHFFGYLGNWVLNAHGLDEGRADPTMVDLLRWHGAEEVEHRTVAFDIYNHMGGTYLERCVHMAFVIVLLLYFITSGARFMYRRDPAAGRYPGFVLSWWKGSRRGHLPSFWKVIGAALRYFKPGYTPHHEGSTEQALAYLARSPAAQAAAHGGNWGTAKNTESAA